MTVAGTELSTWGCVPALFWRRAMPRVATLLSHSPRPRPKRGYDRVEYTYNRQGARLAVSPWPVERPRNWTARVNAKLAENRLESLRQCVNRGRPFGSEDWVKVTGRRLRLEFTLRGPGRPRKKINQ